MHVSPILASLIAFAAAVLLLEVTRKTRNSKAGVNFLIVVAALLLSVFVAAEVSASPEASGGNLFYLWVAYGVVSIFRRKKKSAGDNATEAASDDPAV